MPMDDARRAGKRGRDREGQAEDVSCVDAAEPRREILLRGGADDPAEPRLQQHEGEDEEEKQLVPSALTRTRSKVIGPSWKKLKA